MAVVWPCPMSIRAGAVRIDGEETASAGGQVKEEPQIKQYLLSVYPSGDNAPPPEAGEKIGRDIDALNGELRAAGALVFGGGLYPASTATVVRLKDGEVLTTDGPYAEGKEHVGGFWVIQAPDLDAALEWGRKATRACAVPIEVRPFEGVVEVED